MKCPPDPLLNLPFILSTKCQRAVAEQHQFSDQSELKIPYGRSDLVLRVRDMDTACKGIDEKDPEFQT